MRICDQAVLHRRRRRRRSPEHRLFRNDLSERIYRRIFHSVMQKRRHRSAKVFRAVFGLFAMLCCLDNGDKMR